MHAIIELGLGLRAAFSDARVRLLMILTATLIGAASAAFRWAEGWSWLDAVYFSVITISTVGYGDITPKTDAGKLITIFYVLCGLGLFVATASSIADRIISRASTHREGADLAQRVERGIEDRIKKKL